MRYRIILIVSFLFYSYAALVPRANAGIDNKRSQVERTMGADPRAMISICLISGSLTIQGWDRNEVQVRANDAPPVELRRLDQTGRERATEVRLVTQNESVRGRSCVAFGNIVLKAPRQANLTVETSDAEIKVLNAANVVARSQAGSVSLDRVRGQIDANTIGGDLSVDNSEGMIGLHTVSGSIRASNLKPAETEDRFEATAVSGDITLERVAHQDLRAKTVEGSISYSGALVKNGRYSFQSISGRVNLSLPPDVSFRISGTVGRGSDFVSDFPLQTSVAEPAEVPRKAIGFRHVHGIVGGGDASVVVSCFSGGVHLRKQ